MGKVKCAVINCTNSSYKLTKWKKSTCQIHAGLRKEHCPCQPPFLRFCFPSTLRNGEKRDAWRRLLRRVDQNKSPWYPSESDRVCSSHSVDGEPSVKNPNPTLNLGYERKQDKSRRKLFRTPVSDKKITSTSSGSASAFAFCSENLPPEVKSSDSLIQSGSGNENQYDVMSEHDYCIPSGNIPCLTCQDKKKVIKSLVGKVNNQDDQITKLRKGGLSTHGRRSPFSWTKIKTDAKMKFYTGLSSVKLFHELFDLLKPFINKMNYWRGPVLTSTKIRKSLEQENIKR